jgi:hypothetical protein
LELRLGFLKSRDAIRTRHRTLDGKRREPAQMLRAAAGFVDAADIPPASPGGPYRSRSRGRVARRRGRLRTRSEKLIQASGTLPSLMSGRRMLIASNVI